MGILFCYCLHVTNIFYCFRWQKSLTEVHREQSKNMNISQPLKLQLDILQGDISKNGYNKVRVMFVSEARTSDFYILSFTWQAEQDRDTLLSSSVSISSFRVFSWFPPPLATPSSSLPPPFTRWLLMLSRVWSWTWASKYPHRVKWSILASKFYI